MSSRLALVFAVAAISIGCGSGGEGEGGPLPNPFAAGATPAVGGGGDRPIGAGADRGGGSDRGGGATPAIGGGGSSSSGSSTMPTACTESSQCGPGGTCSRRDSTTGFCFYQCTLPTGSVSGTSAECPGGYMCVRPSQGSVALCLLPCETSASCPFLAGLSAVCSRVATSDERYCAWISPEQAN